MRDLSDDADPLTSARARARTRLFEALAPALLAGIAALAPLLRPLVPPDETRYSEVFREMDTASEPWLLTLNNAPYTEKTPLLFWIGQGLEALGVSSDYGLRVIPALCAMGTALVLVRLARRLGAPLAPWLQAAALLPLAVTQIMLFDPLLAFATWCAIGAWSERRDVRATLWAAAALFAKGPVALAFLVPFGWALTTLRAEPGVGASNRSRVAVRAAGLLALAALPLAAWALAATAAQPGTHRIWWESWGGRIGPSAHHARPPWFYLPFILLGSLPFAPVLVGAGLPARGSLERRLALAAGASFLFLSAVAGKQPHYLLPLCPGLSLWAALVLARPSGALAHRLSSGGLIQIALLFAGLTSIALFGWGFLSERYGEPGVALRSDPCTWISLALSGALLAVCLLAWQAKGGLPLRLAALSIATAGAFVPVHYAAGHLLLPVHIQTALGACSDRPLATFRNFQSGYFNLLARRSHIEDFADCGRLERWWSAHPDGIVVAEPKDLDELLELDVEVLERDRLRGKPQVLLARRAPDLRP